ncbi:hypothetical protein C8J27_108158 [Rhodobacter aestuarii]|uniref:Uncharacterized protein n=1 Tax=Rhodobacter aestuarii TaxID=453582 RepID=A0A1N7PHP8_9RHOB|nr:hypothetical protein [Rhodobacter aestuarii]PTV94421.1 hypothetical protein C8J27_108158 [Rhodobacter aestuarii]SIT09869.1 hypothetical protein SAMN05421580_1103 [Rhodobacter aestuarii]
MRLSSLAVLALVGVSAACGVVNPNTYGALLPTNEPGVMRLSFAVYGNAWKCAGMVNAKDARHVTRQTVPLQCVGMARSGTATVETDPRTQFSNITYKLDNGISGTMLFD